MPPPIIRIGRTCRAHDASRPVAPGMGERSGYQRRSRSTHHRDAGAPRLMGMVCGSIHPVKQGGADAVMTPPPSTIGWGGDGLSALPP